MFQSRGIKLYFIAGCISSMIALKGSVVSGYTTYRVAECVMYRMQSSGVHYVQSVGFKGALCTVCNHPKASSHLSLSSILPGSSTSLCR